MGKRLLSFLVICLCAVSMAFAQKQITGKVVDAATGEAVVGASVLVKGTSVGAATDINGNFTIKNAPDNAKTLVVSYIGMVTTEVAARNGVRVQLQSDTNSLEEQIVVAYGTTKRSAFTGSAAEIKADDITTHVAASATSALVGKVAGVQMTTGSGGPGSSPTIRIRGVGSLNAGTTPLYIVDGAPWDGGISDINPNDIQSMTVLKDASASAIYGARGANGVIIITTKKAKDGEAKVTFDAKWGSNSDLVGRYDEITDPGQYYATHYKAMFNSKYYHGATAEEAYSFADANLYNENNGGLGYQVYTLPEGQKLIGTNFQLNPNAKLGYSDGEYYYQPDDWYKTVMHSSLRQEYNVGVSGSNNKLNYYAGGGYLDDGGMIDNSRYQRYTARTNVDYQVRKWLKLTTNMSYTHSISESPSYSSGTWGSSGNVFYVTKDIAPIYPLYVRNADGSIKTEDGRQVYDISTNSNQHRAAIVGNAVRDNVYNRSQGLDDVFNGNWAAVITPIEGLTINAALTNMVDNYRGTSLYSSFGSASSVDGATSVSHVRVQSLNENINAHYEFSFGKNNMDILVGYEQYKYKYQSLNGYNDHLFDPFISELDNAYGSKEKSTSSYTSRKMNEGIYSRLQYDYDSKYFLSLSYRYDATSVLAPGHRWGAFWSAGAAWQVNKENFLEDAEWINLLKLKLSYGTRGNDNIGTYAYATRYNVSYNNETGAWGVNLAQQGNETLRWEKNYSWNAGVDFNLFRNRLNGTIEFFHQDTKDMLYWVQVPPSSGLSVSGYYDNIASLYNRGIEVSLEGGIIRTKNVEWNVSAAFAHIVNKITKIDREHIGTGQILAEGTSTHNAYMYKYAGVDHNTGEAQYYKDIYYDEKGDVIADKTKAAKIETTTTKTIGEATKYDLGTVLPKLIGGFGTDLKIYGVEISAQFSYQLGGKFYDGGYQQRMHNGQSAGEVMHKDLLNAWSEDNRDSNIPRLSIAAADDGLLVGSQTPIDYFLTSSNYLCLNNLTIGYSLPKSLVNKMQIGGLRIFASGENLFLLTKRKGTDPRYNLGIGSMTSGTGLATSGYSSMRSITAGISVTF